MSICVLSVIALSALSTQYNAATIKLVETKRKGKKKTERNRIHTHFSLRLSLLDKERHTIIYFKRFFLPLLVTKSCHYAFVSPYTLKCDISMQRKQLSYLNVQMQHYANTANTKELPSLLCWDRGICSARSHFLEVTYINKNWACALYTKALFAATTHLLKLILCKFTDHRFISKVKGLSNHWFFMYYMSW